MALDIYETLAGAKWFPLPLRALGMKKRRASLMDLRHRIPNGVVCLVLIS